jgi:hypothetical protein
MTTITINVTEKHINEGTKWDCARCPISKAFVETLGCTEAWVMAHDAVYIHSPGAITRQYKAADPDAVQTFILDFDLGRQVEPTAFEFTALQE